MKVLFWTDGFWPRIGGTETQGYVLVEELHKRGHTCTILAQKDDPNWLDEETYNGITIKRFDFNPLIKELDLKDIRAIKKHLEWILEKFQPDIIHLNTFAWGSALAFLLFKKMFDIPVVATVHAPYYDDSIPPIVADICTHADHICCVSNWALSVMLKHLPSLKEKYKMIYNGLPAPEIHSTPLSFSPPTILLLGRLSSEKGFDTAIRAFSFLKEKGSNAQLIVAGEGTDRPYLEHLVVKLGLQNCTQFTGGLSRNEIHPAINRSTFVVMPSHFEAFGLVAVESMQMKRPVIASNVGGLVEIITNGETGLLVPPQDPIAFYLAMESLIKDTERTIKMGIKGHKQVMEAFTLQKNVDQYENLFMSEAQV